MLGLFALRRFPSPQEFMRYAYIDLSPARLHLLGDAAHRRRRFLLKDLRNDYESLLALRWLLFRTRNEQDAESLARTRLHLTLTYLTLLLASFGSKRPLQNLLNTLWHHVESLHSAVKTGINALSEDDLQSMARVLKIPEKPF